MSSIDPNGIRNTLNSSQSNLNNYSDSNFLTSQLDSEIAGVIQNPISGILTKTLFKINSLTTQVEDRINRLAEDLVKSVDQKGRVELIGSEIIITVTKKDLAQFTAEKQIFDQKISSINSKLHILRDVVNTLNNISNIINVLTKLLAIQEIALSINPATKAIFTVFKKAIKLVFLKEMLTEYAKVLSTQLKSNRDKINELLARFSSLRVEIKIKDEQNTGNIITVPEAETLIASDLLSTSADKIVDSITEEDISSSGLTLILKVEKYGQKELIARAYEKISGMIIAETSPSFVSTADDLLAELRQILSIQ